MADLTGLSKRKLHEANCKCFQIHSEEGVSPENLLCHIETARGYLTDGQEKKYCFGGEWEDDFGKDLPKFNEDLKTGESPGEFTIAPVQPTPEGYERHMKRMKWEVGPTWKNCFPEKDEDKFWQCVEVQAGTAQELYAMTNDELRDIASDLGIKGTSQMNKQQLTSNIRSEGYTIE